MKDRKPEILYSEPVREIMGNPPSGILRWGNIILFFVFLVFLIFSWILKYPDMVPAPVEITTINPPATLVTKITGRIKYLLVRDNEKVSVGQVLAVMETTASIDEIRLLEKTLDSINNPRELIYTQFPMLSQLGEIQNIYAIFVKNLSNMNSYLKNDYYGNKIISLKEEITATEEYIERLKVKEKLFAENRILESKKYRRDSLLYAGKVIPESEIEKSHQAFIRINIELQQVRLDYSEKTIALAEKKQLIRDYKIRQVDEEDKLISLLNESYLNLRAQIIIWENNYLLKSPFDGIVTFTQFWTVNQIVTKDEAVLNVVPLITGSYVGRVKLKMLRSGKVKQGQKVNIKLSSFPYLEFGMVKGIVRTKSLVPSSDEYIIEIDLPDGLTTLYGKKLEFTQNMSGTAEILTEESRIIQKLVNPLRYLITKNK
ncbi:MAG: HlyD family efflux transporter periplasmic adaptor subunit [Bacteroidetes bacterium]|nr:HlyD family efflux transporter periplasmic adaptor subunit [Bacteroidota bacterium]